MGVRQPLLTGVVLLATAATAWAQKVPLAEAVQAGDCFRIRLDMDLAGEMRVNRDGKSVPIKLAATATHAFPERILHVSAGGTADKTARFYETAKALISTGDGRSERVLRDDRRLFVSQRHKDVPLAYCPAGPLTRQELELTSEHFDTLHLTGLLPGKEMAPGESWKLNNAVVQALCAFEGLTEQDLTCKLEEVKDGTARVSVTGMAAGIELGAQVKMTIEASYHFDLGARRLTRLEWKQKDERDQGPASPATTVQTTTTLTRTPVALPDSLTDVKLVAGPDGFEPPLTMTNLVYRDAKGRYELVYGREWQIVGQTNEHLVMRLMERGDFVCQVTATWWTPAAKGQHLTPEQFRQAMTETPDWEPEKELQAGEVPAEGGQYIYRLSALGKLDGLDVMQSFYLVAGPNGEQVVLAFTMPPKQAERLGTRDLSLAGSIAFPTAKE